VKTESKDKHIREDILNIFVLTVLPALLLPLLTYSMQHSPSGEAK